MKKNQLPLFFKNLRRRVNFALGLALFFVQSVWSVDANSKSEQLQCGTYQARGLWGTNKLGQFILSFHKGTTSQRELLLTGGAIDEKLDHLNQHVSVEIEVLEAPKVLTESGETKDGIIQIVKFIDGSPLGQDDLKLLKTKTCAPTEAGHD